MSTTNNTTIDFTGESSEDDDISSQDERDIIEEIENDVKKREVEDDDDQEGEEDKEQQVNESISLREWVEANIRIAEMNDNLKKLDDLERFVKSKEKDLLRNIIAYSLPHIADKLDMNEESRVVNGCGSNWRSVVEVTANVVLRSVLAVVSRTFIPQTHTIHKSIDTRRIDDQMLMDTVVNQEFSSSDEEKGTEIHGSLVMCITSAQTQQVPKKQYRKRKKKPTAESTTPTKARSTSVTTNDSKHIDDTSQEQQNPSVITMVIPADQQDVYNSENKKVYRTDQYLDKFHEGPNFYSHIKDITIGGALGIRKAIQIVKSERSSDVIHSMHGIQMTKGSWIHFKDYLSNDLRPSTNGIALSSREKIANTFLAQVKALKLLYGVSGYAETLLNDAYPPLYLPESHSVLFSANASEKDRREALENILRDIEQMIVQSKSTTDQQWLSDLSKYYRDHYQSVYNNARMDSPPVTLDDKYWDTLKELVEDIDQHFESYGPIQNRVVPLNTVGSNELGPDALEIEKKYKIPKYLRFWDSLLSQDTEYTKMSAINKVFSSIQTRQELMRSMYHKLANIAATPLRSLSVMSGRPQVESKRQIQTQEEQPSNEIDEIPASVETLSYQNSYQLNESQWPSAVLTELALGKDPRPILESLHDKDLKVVRAEIQQWNKEIEAKTRLTIAPRILHQLKFHVEGAEKESEGDQLLGSLAGVPNMTTEEWSAHFREQAVKTGKEEYTVSSMNQALFPEVPWEGKDLSVLQLVYLREQLKRSQLPRYTLSASFKDPDQNITKAFWQGIWELPEGLSNFMEVREPPKPVIRVVGPPPPPPPKQQKPAPPPVTPKIPTIPPVIRPVAPIQPIQPVPPPITPVLPPMRPPPLPPVRLAPPPPPPPPPAPPVQPPPPPQRIPGRTPVQVPDSTYRAEVLQDIQRRLFGQQQR